MKIDINIEQAQKTLAALGVSLDSMYSFYPDATKPLVRPSDLSISARTYYYWSQNGLVKADEKGEWAKLNLVEVLWVKIIDAIRGLGLPVNDVKTIKEMLHMDVYTKMAEYSNEITKIFEKNISDKYTLKMIKDYMALNKNNPELIPSHYKVLATPLGSIIATILLQNKKVNLFVYKEEGQCKIAIEGFQYQDIALAAIARAKKLPHIFVCINDLLEDFIDNSKTQKFSEEFGLIASQEKEILNVIRDGKVREIVIKKDQEENLTITTTSRGELSDDKVQLIKRILSMNMYDDVRVVLRNKKHIYLESKTKKKVMTR
jgi:hypothetical protein